MATVSPYPAIAAVRWLRQVPMAPDFVPVTASHEYEDGGKSFNESNDAGVLVWELAYDGLNSTQWDVLDAHYAEARLVHDFTFVDRFGVIHTGVRYKDKPEIGFVKHQAQSRKITLCKYPA